MCGWPRSPNPLRSRVPKTSDLVAGHLRRRIVRGELSEGDQLPSESVLIEQFAVSRPTLREAFRVLESEGLITVRRGTQGGARVHVPTVEMAAKYAGLVLQSSGATLAEVLDARTLIEPPLAAVIAERSDRKRSAATLRTYIQEHTLTPDDPHYTVEFHGFNRLLMSLTGNDAIVLVTSMLEAIADIVALRVGQSLDPAGGRAMETPRTSDADAAEAGRPDRRRRRRRCRTAVARPPRRSGAGDRRRRGRADRRCPRLTGDPPAGQTRLPTTMVTDSVSSPIPAPRLGEPGVRPVGLERRRYAVALVDEVGRRLQAGAVHVVDLGAVVGAGDLGHLPEQCLQLVLPARACDDGDDG